MIDTTHIKRVFENMMPYIQAGYDTVNDPPEKPYFVYGRKHEILALLTEKDKSPIWKAKKFPLIILYHSQPEGHGDSYVYNYTISPLVSIVNASNENWNTEQRYTNNVEDILYPIKDLLLQEIADNPAFYQTFTDEISYDLVVWDGNPAENKQTGLLFNDYLDGINITFNELRVFKGAQQPCSFA